MNARSRALRNGSSWLVVVGVAAGVAAVYYLWSGLSPELWVDDPAPKASSVKWRASMTLADTALTLLSITLLIGPIRVFRGGAPAVHLPQRRRVGLVAAAFGVAHLVVGLSIHGDLARPWHSFSPSWAASTRWLPVPFSVLGLGNWFGLAVAVALVAPVATSNRPMMRRLRAVRWKLLQRVTYLAYGLLIGHVLLYQRVERRWIGHRVVILTIIASVVIAQLAAFVIERRRRSSASRETEHGSASARSGLTFQSDGTRTVSGVNDHAHPTRPDDADASVRTYSVPEISCDHCKTAIESSVAEVDGVTDVNVDVTSKTVAVSGGADPDIVAAIVEAGYDVA